jgi:hypothetical protein
MDAGDYSIGKCPGITPGSLLIHYLSCQHNKRGTVIGCKYKIKIAIKLFCLKIVKRPLGI